MPASISPRQTHASGPIIVFKGSVHSGAVAIVPVASPDTCPDKAGNAAGKGVIHFPKNRTGIRFDGAGEGSG